MFPRIAREPTARSAGFLCRKWSRLSHSQHGLIDCRCQVVKSEFEISIEGVAKSKESVLLYDIFPENHLKNPRSPYGIAKLTLGKYLFMAAGQDGFRHISIRPSNPYGPGQNFRSAQGLVAVAMAKIARSETITIRGDGSATKDYLFIEDFADACLRLLSTAPAPTPPPEGGTPNSERRTKNAPKPLPEPLKTENFPPSLPSFRIPHSKFPIPAQRAAPLTTLFVVCMPCMPARQNEFFNVILTFVRMLGYMKAS